MRHLRAGFTLVEMSIVLAIIGIVVVGGLTAGATLMERQAMVETNAQLDEINTAIKSFYEVNGRLPCVAPITSPLGNAAFGFEILRTGTPSVSDCDDDATIPGGTWRPAGTTLRIGGLPVRTLGLRDRYAADEYGNRYIYAVDEDLTSPTSATFSARVNALKAGAISFTVRDGSDVDILTNAAYLVLSHGSNGMGAYRYQTGVASPTTCSNTGTPRDYENCDHANAIFRDARFNNGTAAANFFDDFTRYSPYYLLTSVGIGSIGSICNSENANIVRLDTSSTPPVRQYCNGTSWVAEPPASSCNSATVNMTRYNASVMEYCNGTAWVAVP